MSSTDEQMAERRRKNFAVRAGRAQDPDFDGEKSIHWTYNGNQEYNIQLAPHEARKLYDLLAAEFGFGSQQAPDTARDAERFRLAIALEDKAGTLHACVLNHAPDGAAIRAEFDEAMESAAPKLAGNGEGK
jgi:hypothetical protein